MKTRALLLAGLCALLMTACGDREVKPANGSEQTSEPTTVNTFEKTLAESVSELQENMEPVNFMTYYEMSDGTWKTEEHTYKYRLELTGTIPNAEAESTFVILSNSEDITFEQAYKAFGVGSDTADYFKPEDAAIVSVK